MTSKSQKTIKIGMIINFVLVFLVFGTVAYAWFSNYFETIYNFFRPGRLDPTIEVYCYNKTTDSWQLNQANDDTVVLYFGEMTDMATLPDNCEVFLKIKVSEKSTARFNYLVYIEDINLEVTPSLVPINDAFPIDGVSYFDADPSQKCLDYSYFSGADNLNITDITFDGNYQIISRGQSLVNSTENLIKSDEWLYLKITPVLLELQNVFKCVHISYMPYTIKFSMRLQGESRTMNYE